MEKDSNKQVEGRKLTEAQIWTMKYLRMMARKAQEWKAATEKQANRKLSKVAWNESDANPWEEKSDLGKKSLDSDQADHDPNQAKSEFLNRPARGNKNDDVEFAFETSRIGKIRMNVILWISFLGLIFLCLNSIHFLLSLENIYLRITLSVIYAFSLSIILSGSLFRPYRETRWIFVKKGLFYELLVFSGIVLGGILLDLWFMPEFYDIDNKQWFSRSTLYVVSLISGVVGVSHCKN